MGKHGRHRSWKQKPPYPRTTRVSMSDGILLGLLLFVALLVKYPIILLLLATVGAIMWGVLSDKN